MNDQTEENREVVLPRFLGISSRKAKEIVAELAPREAPATRAVVTRLPDPSRISSAGAAPETAAIPWASPNHDSPAGLPPSQLWAPKVEFGGVAPPAAKRDEVEPLSAERSRLHVNVSRQFTRKLEAARKGLGHAIPNATIEQALEAALDLLLEKQARARALVKRAVWRRDGGRCQWPLDSGGCCGSTHRLQLDHIVPWAEWGGETEPNLRVVCDTHNRLAARRQFGERVMGRYLRRRTGGTG